MLSRKATAHSAESMQRQRIEPEHSEAQYYRGLVKALRREQSELERRLKQKTEELRKFEDMLEADGLEFRTQMEESRAKEDEKAQANASA